MNAARVQVVTDSRRLTITVENAYADFSHADRQGTLAILLADLQPLIDALVIERDKIAVNIGAPPNDDERQSDR